MPTNDVICGRFKWCDEHHANDPVGNIPDNVLNQNYKPKTSHPEQSATSTYRPPARASSNPHTGPRLRSELEVQIAITFMVIVLILRVHEHISKSMFHSLHVKKRFKMPIHNLIPFE